MTRCVSYLRLPREKQPTMTEADASFSLALMHQPSKCGRFLVGGPRGWKGWSAAADVASSSGSFICVGCTLQASVETRRRPLTPSERCRRGEILHSNEMQCVSRHKLMHVGKSLTKPEKQNRASGCKTLARNTRPSGVIANPTTTVAPVRVRGRGRRP